MKKPGKPANKAPPRPPVQKKEILEPSFNKFQTAPGPSPPRPNIKRPTPPLKKKAFNPPPPKMKKPVQNIKSSSAPTQYYTYQQLKDKLIPDLDYSQAEIFLAPEEF